MDDRPESGLVTLKSALTDLKAASNRRRLLRRDDPEYTLAVWEEIKLSKVVFQLAQELRVEGQS